MRFLSIIVVFCASIAYSGNCFDKQLGWHFYCDPIEEEEIIQNNKEQTIEEVRKTLEEKKATAVLNPTEQNVKDYIVFQNQQLDRAQKFSSMWQRVLWKNPELDFSVKSPQTTAGNDVLEALKQESLKRTMKDFGKRYGLFFFYSSNCSFCHKYSGILKIFASSYEINVMAISLDGGVLPEWPNTIIDRGEAAKMGMAGKPVPATILFDSKTQDIIPVGFGLLSVSEIEERLLKLIGEQQ